MHILNFQNEKMTIFWDGRTLFERNCSYQGQFYYSRILNPLRRTLPPNCLVFAKNPSRFDCGVVWNDDRRQHVSGNTFYRPEYTRGTLILAIGYGYSSTRIIDCWNLAQWNPRRVDYISVSCIYGFYTTRICISNYINNVHFIEYSSMPRRARLHSQHRLKSRLFLEEMRVSQQSWGSPFRVWVSKAPEFGFEVLVLAIAGFDFDFTLYSFQFHYFATMLTLSNFPSHLTQEQVQ